jgi:hypothetical protein
VFVSAAMNVGGVPYRAFDLARTTDRLAMSQPVFDEIDAVLHRPTLARFVDPDEGGTICPADPKLWGGPG